MPGNILGMRDAAMETTAVRIFRPLRTYSDSNIVCHTVISAVDNRRKMESIGE